MGKGIISYWKVRYVFCKTCGMYLKANKGKEYKEHYNAGHEIKIVKELKGD